MARTIVVDVETSGLSVQRGGMVIDYGDMKILFPLLGGGGAGIGYENLSGREGK